MEKLDSGAFLTPLDISISDPLIVVRDIFQKKKRKIVFLNFPILITKKFSSLLLHILVGGSSKNLNSVPFLRSCISTTIYLNTNLYRTNKSKFSIELENDIIYRVLLIRYRVNIALNKTSSYQNKSDTSFYIIHHNLILKHDEHYNHCISTLLGCIHNRPLPLFRI